MNKTTHQRRKNILKIIGITLLLVGFTCMVIGFVDFIQALSSLENPKLFWCLFIGLPLMGIGSGFSVFAFRSEIATYAKEESLPVTVDAAFELSNAIHAQKCECGQMNKFEANFCSACGKALKKTCPNCGKELFANNLYCNECGNKC